jgi:hypothetical protein
MSGAETERQDCRCQDENHRELRAVQEIFLEADMGWKRPSLATHRRAIPARALKNSRASGKVICAREIRVAGGSPQEYDW